MRSIIALIIAIIPFNIIRIFFYRIFLGYEIDYSSKISMFNFISCKKFKGGNFRLGFFNRIQIENLYLDEDVEIKNLNTFIFLKRVILRKKATICSRNSFIGTRDYFSPYSDVFKIEIGNNSIITNGHLLDCAGKISIGNNVVFGGRNSELWTHGFDANRTMIVGEVIIGNNIYVGSGSKILQGVSICDNVSVGAGTIVSKSINESGFYISSQLIRKSDIADYSENPNLINYEGAGFVRK